MFPTQTLFPKSIACPDPVCSRPTCLFNFHPGPPLLLPNESEEGDWIRPPADKRPRLSSSVNGAASTSTSASPSSSSFTSKIVPPKLTLHRSDIPLSVRQSSLTRIHAAYLLLYSPKLSVFAAKHAEEDEFKCLTMGRVVYRSQIVNILGKLQKRLKEGGIVTDEKSKGFGNTAKLSSLSNQEEEKVRKLTYEDLKEFIMTEKELDEYGYVTVIPSPKECNLDFLKEPIPCVRCEKMFSISSDPPLECKYHYGKKRRQKIEGKSVSIWQCCSIAENDPCTSGYHIPRLDTDQLHCVEPFITSDDWTSQSHAAVALDCEMVETTLGLALAQITILDSRGDIILKEYIKAPGTILDYNTRFSGLTEQTFKENVTVSFTLLQKQLRNLIGAETIIIGHSLDSDLKSMRLVHKKVVDTCKLYPHPAGLPIRFALKTLADRHLGIIIQNAGDLDAKGEEIIGHDADVDARTALMLVRRKADLLISTHADMKLAASSSPTSVLATNSRLP